MRLRFKKRFAVHHQVALCWLWCALPASAQNSLMWTTNYYPVTGATLVEIRQSMRQARPWKERLNVDGYTSWNVNWKFSLAPSASGCRCVSFTTQTVIGVTLPRWVATPDAGEPVKEAWTRYIAALGKHESEHTQHALGAVTELHRRVKEAGEGPDCEGLKKRLNDLGQQVTANLGTGNQARYSKVASPNEVRPAEYRDLPPLGDGVGER